jgi:superfamily II DNA helicase RecQ
MTASTCVDFNSCLSYALSQFPVQYTLKDKQLEALHNIYNGRDLVCLLPTGYGKSLIYQLSPFLLGNKYGVQSPITLVVSPLNSIMKDQVSQLCRNGIRACALDMSGNTAQTFEVDSDDSDSGDDVELQAHEADIDDVIAGKYNLVFSHPEALVSSVGGQRLLRSSVYQDRVCCIAIDEAHMIQEWCVYKTTLYLFK